MRCKYCFQPGANSTGYHEQCFITKVNRARQVGDTVVFDAGGVRREDNTPPSSVADFEKVLAEAQERVRFEQAEKEREERERKEKEAKERANRTRGYRPPFMDDWFFRTFFEGRYTAGADKGREQDYSTSWSGENQYKQVRTEVSVSVDAKKLRQLLMLCHPDKHANSALSDEVTKWLLTIKSQLEGK